MTLRTIAGFSHGRRTYIGGVPYHYWLLIVSALFLVAERVRPARPGQALIRPQVANDAFYLVFNGHFYAVWTGAVVGWLALKTLGVMESIGLAPEAALLDDKPFALQFVVLFLARDFIQWSIHVMLHRVPFLWSFHKVHHSIHAMDWLGNFRFHWVEMVVYRTLQFVPLFWLGGGEAILAVAVVGTVWGHFNHANLDVGIGPLAYVFNSPRMHLWHHDASDEGGTAKNFGIALSCWDWIFGTAYWPRDRVPERIGYPEDEEMPSDLVRQIAFPAAKVRH